MLSTFDSILAGSRRILSRSRWKYVTLGLIARGMFTKVILVKPRRLWPKSQGEEVELNAAKVCHVIGGGRKRKKRRNSNLEELKLEVALLQRVQHRNVISLKEAFHDKAVNKFWIVMESLQGFLDVDILKRALTTVELRVVGKEIFDAVEFIHSKGVMHKDLKFENILISNTGCLKLCDFGIAEQFDEGKPKRVVAKQGTWYTRAPELYEIGGEYDEAVDIWSMGVLLYLCTTADHTRSRFLKKLDLPQMWWLSYKISNEKYFITAMDISILDYKQFPELKTLMMKIKYQYTPVSPILERSEEFREAFDFCMQALCPRPTTGSKKYPISRVPTLERATLEGLRNTKLIREAKNVSTVERRNIIIGLLKDIHNKKHSSYDRCLNCLYQGLDFEATQE